MKPQLLIDSTSGEHVRKYKMDDYISSISIYRFKNSAPVQFFPEGVFEVYFQLDGDFSHQKNPSAPWELRPKSFVGGLHTKSFFVKPNQNQATCIGVKFKAHNTSFLLQEKLSDYANKVRDLRDIWGAQCDQLINDLVKDQKASAVEKLIVGFFLDQMSGDHQIERTLPLDEIMANQGRISVAHLADSAALSKSHFRKSFRERIGLSPLDYCRVIRVKHALQQINKGDFKNLTQVAYELGYFDQAHFHREFKFITHLTPKNYLRSQHS